MGLPAVLTSRLPIILYISIPLIVLALLIEKVLYPYLKRRFARTQRRDFRYVINALSGITSFWIFLLMLYFIDNALAIEKTFNVNLVYLTISQVLAILFVISIAYFISKYIRLTIEFNTRKGNLPPNTILQSVLRIAVILLAIIFVLQVMNISLTPIVGALGIGGIAIALALQDSLANYFAGLYLIATKQVNKGDYIKLSSGEEGTVIDIAWRATTIRTVDNNINIIPNGNMSTVSFINYTLGSRHVMVTIDFSIEYDSDLERAEQVSLDVIKELQSTHEWTVHDYEPAVRFVDFGMDGIDMRAVLLVLQYDKRKIVISDFIKNLQIRFQKEGIIIPFHQVVIYQGKDES